MHAGSASHITNEHRTGQFAVRSSHMRILARTLRNAARVHTRCTLQHPRSTCRAGLYVTKAVDRIPFDVRKRLQ